MRYPIYHTVDIAHPKPVVRYQEALLVEGDNTAHELIVTVLHDGAPQSLQGCQITASFVREDGVTAIATGSATGNIARVVFPSAVYLPGALGMRMKVSSSAGRMTIINAAFVVRTGDTDVFADTGVIPNVADLLAMLTAMDASKAACDAATGRANTAAASANTATTSANTATQAANAGAANAQNAAAHAGAQAAKWDTVAFDITMLSPDGAARGRVEQLANKTTLIAEIPQGRITNATLRMDSASGMMYQRTPVVPEVGTTWRYDPVTTMLYRRVHGY